MKQQLLFILLFCFSVLEIIAQPSNEFNNIPSPDAYGLGKYYDVPVDKSNGIPSVAIPLTTVQIGGLSVPLNLTYHASGLQVGDVSSNVGLGWAFLLIATKMYNRKHVV